MRRCRVWAKGLLVRMAAGAGAAGVAGGVGVVVRADCGTRPGQLTRRHLQRLKAIPNSRLRVRRQRRLQPTGMFPRRSRFVVRTERDEQQVAATRAGKTVPARMMGGKGTVEAVMA